MSTIDHMILSDGSLRAPRGKSFDEPCRWVEWDPDDGDICLDGRFTIDELRDMVAHMEAVAASS